MKIWIDAQLPPTLANWLTETFGLEARALRDLGLRDAQDTEIFELARSENIVIMTKDSDFIDLVCRLGSPPQILWLTCGNVTPYCSSISEKNVVTRFMRISKQPSKNKNKETSIFLTRSTN